MTYSDLLRKVAGATGSIVCVGLDPVLERIPLQGDPEAVITEFCIAILDAFKEAGCLPGAVKPNSAYYEQYGEQGMRALKNVVQHAKKLGLLVILDAKRGDIGKTSDAYARAVFDELGVDAVTVAPYMGRDSVEPFTKKGGVYVLVRTSNKGARDMQDLDVEGTPLYMKTAENVVTWNTGAVVGATYPEELETIAKFFNGNVPLLIPGVGSQGASAKETVEILKKSGYDLGICRINSSSGITYAYETSSEAYPQAAVNELKKLNAEIGKVRT